MVSKNLSDFVEGFVKGNFLNISDVGSEKQGECSRNNSYTAGFATKFCLIAAGAAALVNSSYLLYLTR